MNDDKSYLWEERERDAMQGNDYWNKEGKDLGELPDLEPEVTSKKCKICNQPSVTWICGACCSDAFEIQQKRDLGEE